MFFIPCSSFKKENKGRRASLKINKIAKLSKTVYLPQEKEQLAEGVRVRKINRMGINKERAAGSLPANVSFKDLDELFGEIRPYMSPFRG